MYTHAWQYFCQYRKSSQKCYLYPSGSHPSLCTMHWCCYAVSKHNIWTCLNVEEAHLCILQCTDAVVMQFQILLCFKIQQLNMFVKCICIFYMLMLLCSLKIQHMNMFECRKSLLGVLRCRNTTYGLLYCCCVTHIASHTSPAHHLECFSWTGPHDKLIE